MDLGETNFDSQASKHPCPDVTPPQSPGSFTRLFGSGEGVLTPSGTAESSQPPLPREFRETVGGLPRGSQPPSGSVRNRPSIPPANEPSGFTQAFPPPSVPEPPESKAQPGSFTKEFGSPPSWRSPEPPPSSTTAQAYIPGPGGTFARVQRRAGSSFQSTAPASARGWIHALNRSAAVGINPSGTGTALRRAFHAAREASRIPGIRFQLHLAGVCGGRRSNRSFQSVRPARAGSSRAPGKERLHPRGRGLQIPRAK